MNTNTNGNSNNNSSYYNNYKGQPLTISLIYALSCNVNLSREESHPPSLKTTMHCGLSSKAVLAYSLN